MQAALARLRVDRSQTLFIADVGASMGFDALYLLRRLTRNFREPLPCDRVRLSLVEGDQESIARGQRTLKKALATGKDCASSRASNSLHTELMSRSAAVAGPNRRWRWQDILH